MKQEFIKTRSTRDIILSATLVVVAVLLAFIPDNASLQITGYLMLVIGALLLFTLKSQYRNVATRDVFKKKAKFFDISQKENIMKALDEDPSRIDAKLEGKGSGVILDVFYNEKDAFIQPYSFYSGQYEPCGEMRQYKAEQVKNLIA